MHRFDQQPAHHGVALFADGSQPPPSAAGFLARIQSEITRDFSAAGETRYRTNRQYKGQRGYRTDARMSHEKHCILAAFCFFQNRAVQLRDCRIELVEQFQKFFASPTCPRTEREASEFPAALPAEQFLLAAQTLAHRQKVQLIAQHRAQGYELVAMPEQLPEIPLARGGHPDFGKTLREQQVENEPGIAFVGLLLANFRCANLGRVADPKFVPEFCKQALEPVNRPRRFDSHANRLLQTTVEGCGFSVFVL